MPLIAAPNGGTLLYAESGPAAARPVLLLHAALQTHESMAPLVEVLEPLGVRLVRPDLPGHGRSELPGGGLKALSIGGMADAVETLIDRLGLGAPLVVGYSLGGIVGIELGLRGRAAGLAVLASRIRPAAGARATFAPESIRQRSPLWARQLAEKHVATPWESLAAALGELLATWPGFDSAALAALPVPLLVVQGDRDQMVPLEQGQELARLAPGGSFRLVPRAGHPELLYRDETRVAVKDFIGKLLC
ncbi:alpha/beta fold hydrolase [Symbiobacterium terraclitae]|uniref:alpha/beta fold hydrolase n=1 Tax=Symbiobacterium terraclitae TaxID=557451 RepID=UPI0035B53EC0